MRIVRAIDDLRAWRGKAGQVAFVPTMGAFHEGHLALMRQAKADFGCCAVSLFVNPKQFGPNEDLSRYPRNEEEDARMAAEAGADLLFCPSPEEIYPECLTEVSVKSVSALWEGAQRPGHFDGVALVVLKLFNMVQPNAAYFGLKDLQQCAVIRRMVLDLNVPLELRFLETVRSPEGLALSSRNRYLNVEQIRIASQFPAILQQIAAKVKAGTPDDKAVSWGAESLEQLGLLPDYITFVDPVTMQPCPSNLPSSRLMSAVRFAGIRLLDNISVH